MPALYSRKTDGYGGTGKNSKYTKVGQKHETKSPKCAKPVTDLMANGSVENPEGGGILTEAGAVKLGKTSAPKIVEKAEKSKVSGDTMCEDPTILVRIDRDGKAPRNGDRESVDQDTMVPRNGKKESRTQRRKKKLEADGSTVARVTPSNGVDTVAKDKEAARNGEKETRTQRKRKRGEREEAGNTVTQVNSKRPKNTHQEVPRSPCKGTKDSMMSPGPYSSRPAEDESKPGSAAAIEANDKRNAHVDMALVQNEKKPKRTKGARGAGHRGKGQILDGKKTKGLSGLDTVSKASELVSSWKTSEATGGRLIRADPVFSGDEKFLFLALPSILRIYSCSTSLLVRSLPLEASSSRKAAITGFVISPTSPNHIYIFTSRGRLEIWDWIEGVKIQRWEFESEIDVAAIISASPAENKSDIIYVVEKKYEKWRIKLFELAKGVKPSMLDGQTKVLYECQQQISNLKVLCGGRVVVATSGKYLVVGTTKEEVTAGSYVWMEFTSPDWLTCLDVRESSKEPIPPKRKKKLSKGGSSKCNPDVDVVVGDIKGAIFVHSDLLNSLTPNDQKDRSTRLEHLARGASRRRHWHREAVHSVKWSLDGNYILSGGSETVLVLWQLDTDKEQYLPHLSATVESIVVSPKGSSYAIRLADNSVMILSATELKPKASIAGIQAKSWGPQRILLDAQVKTVASREAQRIGESSELPKVPSVIHPLNPTQILLAVPSSQSSSFSSVLGLSSPYLQTFDFVSARHISRQPLARTNVTSLNVGPEANKIGEPNIELISISKDGKWLASVDEWNPPRMDLEFLCLDGEGMIREQNRRREVYLKFWNWNDESGVWELVTRVDTPHFSSRCDSIVGAGRVTDVATDPSGLGFATIGMDGSVKLWRPRKRTRDGVVLKGKDSRVLVNWGCHQAVQIGTRGGVVGLSGDQPVPKDEHLTVPCLAYSADGSVVAASYPSNLGQDRSAVHLIDTASGEIQHVRDGVQIGGIAAIGMLGPYVILAGEALIVWDVVQNTLQYGIKLRLSGLSLKQEASMVRLAVANNTFAIAVPVVEFGKRGEQKQSLIEKAHSEVMIFDPVVLSPLFSVSLPNLVTALLPTVGSRGYVVLDLAAELQIITDKGGGFVYSSTIASQELLPEGGDTRQWQETAIEDPAEDQTGTDGKSDDEEQPPWLPLQPETASYDDDSPPVVRQEQLAEIFDVGPSHALPYVNELFERVVGLFARKPVPRI